MKKIVLLTFMLCLGLAAGAVSPQLVKKARKASYDWARQYSIAVQLEGRQAEERFLDLFERRSTRIVQDYSPDLSASIPVSEYIKNRKKLDAKQKPFYEIQSVRIASEKAVASTGEKLEYGIVMVMWTNAPTGNPNETQLMEYELEAQLVYNAATDECCAKSIKKLGQRVLPKEKAKRESTIGSAVKKEFRRLETTIREAVKPDMAEGNRGNVAGSSPGTGEVPERRRGETVDETCSSPGTGEVPERRRGETVDEAGSAGQRGETVTEGQAPDMTLTFQPNKTIKVIITNPEFLPVRLKVFSNGEFLTGEYLGSRDSIKKIIVLPKGQYEIHAKVGETIIKKEITVK